MRCPCVYGLCLAGRVSLSTIPEKCISKHNSLSSQVAHVSLSFCQSIAFAHPIGGPDLDRPPRRGFRSSPLVCPRIGRCRRSLPPVARMCRSIDRRRHRRPRRRRPRRHCRHLSAAHTIAPNAIAKQEQLNSGCRINSSKSAGTAWRLFTILTLKL